MRPTPSFHRLAGFADVRFCSNDRPDHLALRHRREVARQRHGKGSNQPLRKPLNSASSGINSTCGSLWAEPEMRSAKAAEARAGLGALEKDAAVFY